MIVADTGAIIALVDAADAHHRVLSTLFEESSDEWVLPWAILPEVDHLLGRHVGAVAQRAFMRDIAEGAFSVEWGTESDLVRANDLCTRYRDLDIGLVDSVVIATAERLEARAIATVDLRDFGAVAIIGSPRLLPRDRDS